jgi:hypothetical protein
MVRRDFFVGQKCRGYAPGKGQEVLKKGKKNKPNTFPHLFPIASWITSNANCGAFSTTPNYLCRLNSGACSDEQIIL